MSRFEIDELQLEEVDFINLSHRQLLNLFIKHKKISVNIDHKTRMDLTYVSGEKYGVKFTELISITHVERLPKHHNDSSDEERFKTITDKAISPLSFGKAVKKFHTYYQKFKDGKVMKIKDLTEDELDEIVREMNKPIGEIDDREIDETV